MGWPRKSQCQKPHCSTCITCFCTCKKWIIINYYKNPMYMFCIYLSMYREVCARHENQLLTVVISGGWVMMGKRKRHSIYLYYSLKCWFYEHDHVLIFQRKENPQSFKCPLPSVSCSKDPLERRLEKDSTTVHFFLYLHRRSRRDEK